MSGSSGGSSRVIGGGTGGTPRPSSAQHPHYLNYPHGNPSIFQHSGQLQHSGGRGSTSSGPSSGKWYQQNNNHLNQRNTRGALGISNGGPSSGSSSSPAWTPAPAQVPVARASPLHLYQFLTRQQHHQQQQQQQCRNNSSSSSNSSDMSSSSSQHMTTTTTNTTSPPPGPSAGGILQDPSSSYLPQHHGPSHYQESWSSSYMSPEGSLLCVRSSGHNNSTAMAATGAAPLSHHSQLVCYEASGGFIAYDSAVCAAGGWCSHDVRDTVLGGEGGWGGCLGALRRAGNRLAYFLRGLFNNS